MVMPDDSPILSLQHRKGIAKHIETIPNMTLSQIDEKVLIDVDGQNPKIAPVSCCTRILAGNYYGNGTSTI